MKNTFKIPVLVFSIIFLLLNSLFLFSQTVTDNTYTLSGTIKSEGDAVPFAHIYLEGSSRGTVANEFGEYSFQVPAGNHTIVSRAVGYSTYRRSITIDANRKFDINLKVSSYSIGEIVVRGSEDPAYEIMRQVIDHRDKHYKAVEGFSCHVYLKGLNRVTKAPDEIFGFNLTAFGLLDSNNTGIIYLSESESEFHFQRPDKIREVMISSKVSGDFSAFSWNMASDFLFSVYQNTIYQEALTQRVIISPLADNAFFYYDFKLKNTAFDGSQLIYDIEVIPKRANDPVVSGLIQINHELWNVRQLSVELNKNNGLNLVDTLKISQSYVPISDSVWMPMSQHFEFVFNILGIEAEGYFTGIYTDYTLNPNFERGFFTNELLKVEEGADKRDSLYWSRVRPIPLTSEEQRDYKLKDSIAEIRNTDAFKDSIDRIYNRFSPWDLLFGYRYRNSKRSTRFVIPTITSLFQFNTIEGFVVQPELNFRKSAEDGKYHQFNTSMRYGFSSNDFYAKLGYRYFYNTFNSSSFFLEGGHFPQQFNTSSPIHPVVNTAYTLFWGENYKKMYERSYLEGGWQSEIVNGLRLTLTISGEERSLLDNTTDFSFRKTENKNFTRNEIKQYRQDFKDWEPHYAAGIETNFRIRFQQKYISRPDRKIITGYRGPQWTLGQKTFTGFGNQIDDFTYTHFQSTIEHNLRLGLIGNSKYLLRGGLFQKWQGEPAPMDLMHFNGKQTIFARIDPFSYYLLDYYKFSTFDPYLEFHFLHSFDGFIANKIPLIKQTDLAFTSDIKFLFVEDLPAYYEFSFGMKNILSIFRVNYTYGHTIGSTGRHGLSLQITQGF
ncbi:MAG: carboxypeptidase-like regulatory domain-containing protein [Chitinophagaceae bacterium]|nr:MAG: carboxypeptidase-like regulatory domain-containing protein [Chitinophagaceae bacterium]